MFSFKNKFYYVYFSFIAYYDSEIVITLRYITIYLKVTVFVIRAAKIYLLYNNTQYIFKL